MECKNQLMRLKERTDKEKNDSQLRSVEHSIRSGGTDSSSRSVATGQARSNLKKIEPPTFSGEPTEYIDFKIRWNQLKCE